MWIICRTWIPFIGRRSSDKSTKRSSDAFTNNKQSCKYIICAIETNSILHESESGQCMDRKKSMCGCTWWHVSIMWLGESIIIVDWSDVGVLEGLNQVGEDSSL
jgi:hypothetical protein